VSGTFHVTATVGSPDSVTLHVDDNVVDTVDVHVPDDTLQVGLKSGSSVHGASLAADVTAQHLAGVEVSGAAQVSLHGAVNAASLDLSASGAGQLTGSIGAQHAGLELSGASHVTLSGSVGALDLHASGASNLQGQDLQVSELTVELSGHRPRRRRSPARSRPACRVRRRCTTSVRPPSLARTCPVAPRSSRDRG
jgi:hypothetical protein